MGHKLPKWYFYFEDVIRDSWKQISLLSLLSLLGEILVEPSADKKRRGRRWLWSSVQVLCINSLQKLRRLRLWFWSKLKWKRSLNCKIRVWGLDHFPAALPGWGCRYWWLLSIWVMRPYLIRESIRPLRAPEKHWGVSPVSRCEVVTCGWVMLYYTLKISASFSLYLCLHEASSFLCRSPQQKTLSPLKTNQMCQLFIMWVLDILFSFL